jgi:hypothetical protein
MKLLDNRGRRAKPASPAGFERLGFAQFFHRRKFGAPSAKNTNGCKLSNEGSGKQQAKQHSAFSTQPKTLCECAPKNSTREQEVESRPALCAMAISGDGEIKGYTP